MSFGIYSYTVTVLFFCGSAFLLYCIACAIKKTVILSKKDWKIVFLTIVIMVFFTSPAEYFALRFRAWMYNPQQTFFVTFFGAEIETYLFIIFVSLVVSIATLVYANHQDRKNKKNSK